MKKILLVTLLAISFGAYAGNCDNLYPGGKEFVIPNTIELCNSFYVIRYDVEKKANIASIDVLKANHAKVERGNNFHADSRLPATTRATPSDYANTGYDKGHMTPAGDAGDDNQMSETFLMSNMTPQLPSVNRVSWRELEEMIRNRANQTGKDINIITGAIYSDKPKTIGKTGVPVPSAYYKIVYFPSGTVAYYAENVENAPVRPVDVSGIEQLTGLRFP